MSEVCPFCGTECEEHFLNEVDFSGTFHYCGKCHAAKLPESIIDSLETHSKDGWALLPREVIDLE